MTPFDAVLPRGDTEIASEPALKTPAGADPASSKPLKKRRSFILEKRRQKSATKVKLKPSDAMLIIGFDAEWVTEALDRHDDDDDVDGDIGDRSIPGQTPHNRILSYQYACS